MARIRTVKPEFFRHEDLYLAEVETGWPMRLAFEGLWTVADREGRFRWRPNILKLDCLPYDDVDFSKILEVLADKKFIIKYQIGKDFFGCIPSFRRHQLVNRDEPPSEIPSPSGEVTPYDRPPNATVRARIYARDNYICAYCGRNMASDSRIRCIDHVIPYSRGGTNRELNLVTSCKKCNASKVNKTPKEAGLPWPEGYGESYEAETVNGGLTVRQQAPDMEMEYGSGSGSGTEMEVEPPKPPKGDRRCDLGTCSLDPAECLGAFDQLWAEYPRHEPSRKKARVSWCKAQRVGNVPPTTELIAWLAKAKASDQWQNPDKIPHATTWINQRRWEGDPPPSTGGGQNGAYKADSKRDGRNPHSKGPKLDPKRLFPES